MLKKGLELKNQLDEDGPRSWAGGVKGILSAPPLLASGRGVWREPIELTGGRGRRGPVVPTPRGTSNGERGHAGGYVAGGCTTGRGNCRAPTESELHERIRD